MKKIKNEAPDRDVSRKAIKIVCSILVSVAVWFYVNEIYEVNVTTSVRDIPVEFSGEDTALADKGLMLLSGYDTTVDLTLKGPRRVLWKLDADEIRIVADTSGIQDTGIQTLTYEVIYPDNIPRSKVSVQSASVYSVTVTVGQLYTKEVPIQCQITGKVAEGYVAEEVVIDPEVLVLRAQRDDLLNVNYAKVTVDITNARETVIKTVEYQLYDYNDIPIENDNIRATTKLIQVTVPVKTVKDVPLRINFVEAPGSTMDQVRYSFSQDSIRLKGEQEVLANIDSITLDTLYLQDLEDYQTLNYTIPLPEGTEIVSGEPEVSVTISVTGVSERRISTSNFEYINVPEGHTAQVETGSLEILVRGLTGEVQAMTGDNLLVTVDLSSVQGTGSFTVPVSVQVTGYNQVGVKGSYQVIVNVSTTETRAAQTHALQPAALPPEREDGTHTERTKNV